jgi:hypothetical protein
MLSEARKSVSKSWVSRGDRIRELTRSLCLSMLGVREGGVKNGSVCESCDHLGGEIILNGKSFEGCLKA